MGTYEEHPSPEPSKDDSGRQQSTKERPIPEADDLLVWLSKATREHGREETFDLLLNKVKQGQFSRETLQSALSRAGGDDEAIVIHVVMEILDRTTPPYGG